MMLSEKQSQMFVDRYRNRYHPDVPEDERVWAPTLPAYTQKDEVEAWIDILKKILWKRWNDTYKYRNWWKRESLLEKAFNSLYLNYGPTYVEEDGSPAKEQIWLDDVLSHKDNSHGKK